MFEILKVCIANRLPFRSAFCHSYSSAVLCVIMHYSVLHTMYVYFKGVCEGVLLVFLPTQMWVVEYVKEGDSPLSPGKRKGVYHKCFLFPTENDMHEIV